MVVKARLKEPEEFFFYDGSEESFKEFLAWAPPMYSINGRNEKR